MLLSSPHTRGCFYHLGRISPSNTVFPAHTGVFPKSALLVVAEESLPRTHGGVSVLESATVSLAWSSPHTRGCFQKKGDQYEECTVFPAHTGVFLFLMVPA